MILLTLCLYAKVEKNSSRRQLACLTSTPSQKALLLLDQSGVLADHSLVMLSHDLDLDLDLDSSARRRTSERTERLLDARRNRPLVCVSTARRRRRFATQVHELTSTSSSNRDDDDDKPNNSSRLTDRQSARPLVDCAYVSRSLVQHAARCER